MKLLRVLAPLTDDGYARRVGEAVEAFNRGLDIRLRFLSIGIDDRELRVDGAAHAAEAVGEAIDEYAPDVVLLFGEGPAAVAAATVVVRAARVLVRAGAGRREGEHADAARAVDRIATMLLTADETARETAESEELPGALVHVGDPQGAEAMERVIHALRQARLGPASKPTRAPRRAR